MFRKLIAVGVIGIIVGGYFAKDKITLFIAAHKSSLNKEVVEYYFDATVGLDSLAADLFNKKVIEYPKSFVLLGEYKNLNSKRLASGKYLLKPSTSYKDVLNGFTINSNGNGNAEVEVDVTFNNCKNIEQLVGKVSKNLLLDSVSLINYIKSDSVLKKYDFNWEQMPAMFIPNTYKMFYDTDPAQFVARMAKEFKSFWTTERKNKLKEIGLNSPSEAVTLASIVYSEQTRVKKEWPIIAGLYLNRLKKGIRLQSDPTFKFCWGDKLDKVQRLLAKHREIDCAYNTYKINGLPPGPICIPSSKVVDAVLNRAEVKYIFMCAKPDYSGEHNFAVNGLVHGRNARLFQKWIANELKKQNGK